MFEVEQLTADLDMDMFYERYVDKEKFQKICEDCEQYNKNWSCPPFDFDSDDIWKSYRKIKIIAFKYVFSEDLLNETFSKPQLDVFLKKLERTKIKLMNIIYKMEDDDSLALFIGNCNLCARCTREFGMPCKMPFKLRYSIESLGGDVDSLCKDVFGDEILYAENGKLPEYMYFVGALLYDKI